MLKLYHNDMSSCAQKVRFVLAEKGLEWDGQEMDLRRGDQLKPEFLKINPKGLVPVLVHDDNTFIESNVIIEYLNEAFPEAPLMPDDVVDRAKVRSWMKRLDDGIHMEVIVISFAIAFRHQLIEVCDTKEEIDEFLAKVPDPYTRDMERQVVHDGVEAPRFAQAIHQFEILLGDLDKELSKHEWIVGGALTLADIAYVPYATRLEHLHLTGLWDNKPNFARWYDRIKETDGYKKGLEDWFNPKYLPLMDKVGAGVWPRVSEMIEEIRANN